MMENLAEDGTFLLLLPQNEKFFRILKGPAAPQSKAFPAQVFPVRAVAGQGAVPVKKDCPVFDYDSSS